MEITTSLIPHHHIPLTETLQIISLLSPINTVAPPPIKSRHATTRRSLLKRRRRTHRRSPPSPKDDIPFLGGADDGSGSNFGGGGGWNFGGGGSDGFFSSDNNDNDNNNNEDPAFDFVFEVVCWIVFSNCVHFAFTRFLRLLSEEREKVPLGMASVCLD